MTEPSEEIIAEPAGPSLAAWAGAAALLWGALAAFYYFRIGLTLSHYDSRGHLVVARRVLDSLTPGWVQVGAVWLPLPHLLNLLPVQVDLFYRTGASAVAISVLSLALLLYAAVRLVRTATGSAVAAIATAALIASNPNLLYLQSTPMTEPLLLALLAMGLTCLYEAVAGNSTRHVRNGFIWLALACLTRYEAWPITGAAVAAFGVAEWRARGSLSSACGKALRGLLIPVGVILLFFVHSKATVDAWFVTSGFYVPDPMYAGKFSAAVGAVWWGARVLGSDALAIAAGVAILVLLTLVVRDRRNAALFVPLAWLGATALAWYAFYVGHPFRVRYMVPSVTAAAVLTGLALGRLPRRWQTPIASGLLATVLWQARPFDPQAAMVLEAQWDRPRSAARRQVTACLPEPGHGEVIMASMGSLAHYMQELSRSGFAIKDFLHEGNGVLWMAALNGPSRYVRWILIEEVAEGGDMLATRARDDPRFLAGFDRVCSGGGVTLYRNTRYANSD